MFGNLIVGKNTTVSNFSYMGLISLSIVNNSSCPRYKIIYLLTRVNLQTPRNVAGATIKTTNKVSYYSRYRVPCDSRSLFVLKLFNFAQIECHFCFNVLSISFSSSLNQLALTTSLSKCRIIYIREDFHQVYKSKQNVGNKSFVFSLVATRGVALRIN